MILADSSVWADHMVRPINRLDDVLGLNDIIIHPFVVGELLLGSPPQREVWRKRFGQLPQMLPVRHADLMGMIDDDRLFGVGIGYVDAHLVAATRGTAGCLLWTRDKRLRSVAARFGIDAGFD